MPLGTHLLNIGYTAVLSRYRPTIEFAYRVSHWLAFFPFEGLRYYSDPVIRDKVDSVSFA